MDNHVVIMAGGIGSRFWPMSTPECPKQFIDVMGCGRSLIQLTADRFDGVCPRENMWVVTSEKYIDIVREQLPEIPESNILAEPCARNTAPCIAFACWKIKKKHPNANIVVTPSDALVIDTGEFRRVMEKALRFTDDSSAIVTIGIRPTRPETGYGYIAAADQLQTVIQIFFGIGRTFFSDQTSSINPMFCQISVHGLRFTDSFPVSHSSGKHSPCPGVFFKIEQSPSGSFQKG